MGWILEGLLPGPADEGWARRHERLKRRASSPGCLTCRSRRGSRNDDARIGPGVGRKGQTSCLRGLSAKHRSPPESVTANVGGAGAGYMDCNVFDLPQPADNILVRLGSSEGNRVDIAVRHLVASTA